MNPLLAITPIDGRYSTTTNTLVPFFSEYALFKYRLRIEFEYFIALCEIALPKLQDFDHHLFQQVRNIYYSFTPDDCLRIKEIETATNHDIKAVEYYLQEKFKDLKLQKYISYLHIGLTSQDINTSANILAIKAFFHNILVPTLNEVLKVLDSLANQWENVTMLSHTHGQPATPTTLGKEIRVFHYRIVNQLKQLRKIEYRTKFGGAVGNFHAHRAAFPNIDWESFADDFCRKLGLVRNKHTTQVSNYDELAEIFDNIKRINTIFIDLNVDMWLYISYNYFTQKTSEQEVGSSTMPHKINPINFENSEGNIYLAQSLLECFSRKLPVSRMQRDLTDSTILRNVGSAFAYSLIAYQSTLKGLHKLTPNTTIIQSDLDKNYLVISEAIQTILRREGFENSYELLKNFSRNTTQNLTKKSFDEFINTLSVSSELINELKTLR